MWRTQAFSVKESCAPAVLRLVARLEDGLHTEYLPLFPTTSWEFSQLQAYYGSLFLAFLLPEHFGQASNVQKRKGCLETRFVDLTPVHVTKELLKLLLAYWKDFSVRLIREAEASIEALSGLQTALERLKIAGLLPRVTNALARARKTTPILIAFRLTRTLLHRTDTCDEGSITLGNQSYCIRQGAMRLVQRLQSHSRCRLLLCCSKPDLASEAANILKEESLITIKRSDIWKEYSGFDVKNTVFVGWSGLKLRQDQGKPTLRKLEKYLLQLLDTCDSDVQRYFETHSYS